MTKLGEIGLNTPNGIVKLPIYDTSDFSSSPTVKVQTTSGIGGLNLVDPTNSDATPVKIQTSSGIKAVSKTGPSTGPNATINATLNNQTAQIIIFEDTTGDGTADNTEIISVSDGTTTSNLNNIAGGTGNNYWIQTELTNSNIEKTAEINSIELNV